MPEEIKIIPTNGYYEVYINGKFYCSADTVVEAANEIEKEVNNGHNQSSI